MRTFIGMALAFLLLLGLRFAQGNSPVLGSIRGDVFTKGTNGEPAVLPGARIVQRILPVCMRCSRVSHECEAPTLRMHSDD